LPAIAAILKTRKRKLAQISSNVDSTLTTNTQFYVVVKTVLDNINVKLNSLITLTSNPAASASINKSLSAFLAVELPSNLLFNTSIFKQSQISYFLYV
jgi:D-arabinose 5-phosphate isomerase GutQ